MESAKIHSMQNKSLTPIQQEFTVGTTLGDGYVMRTTKGYCLRIHQGIKQKEFVEWKYQIIKDLVNTPPRLCGNSYYFRTVSNPIFERYRELFYKERIKVVPENIKDLLTPFGLAVWVMDDGSKDWGCVRINSHSFSYSDHLRLQRVLADKFNLECNIHKDKGMFRLWIKSKSIPQLIQLVEPHFVPSMLYKLPRNDYS